MKKLKQMYRCMEEWMSGNGKTTGCPTKTLGHDRRRGFTLVELVIVIAIVIILSVISVPIYRGYVDKAKMSEAYALLGSILSAQKAYYSEYGNFLSIYDGGQMTSYNAVLGIDARGNKYVTNFQASGGGDKPYSFEASVYKPKELQTPYKRRLFIDYNITTGCSTFYEWSDN